tara:strand:- start:15 stop:677 length:663 start_codon:yes stop_codon:yes gene_type:complete
MYVDFFLRTLLTLAIIIDPIGYIIVFTTIIKTYKINIKENNETITLLSSSDETTINENINVKEIAFKSTIYAFIILIINLFIGKLILEILEVNQGTIKITGGLSLLKVSYTLIYSKDKDITIKDYNKLYIYPFSTGILAGPGTISTIIILSHDLNGDIIKYLLLISCIIINLTICLIGSLLGLKFMDKINNDIILIINMMVGLLLSSLSINFIYNGIIIL